MTVFEVIPSHTLTAWKSLGYVAGNAIMPRTTETNLNDFALFFYRRIRLTVTKIAQVTSCLNRTITPLVVD